MNENNNEELSWKKIYGVGAIFASIALIGIVSDIVFSSMHGAGLTGMPVNAAGRFVEFGENPLLGLYQLDFLNLCINLMMIPMYYAIVGAHRNSGISYAGLALVLFLIGNAVFVANNAALPMYELAERYNATMDENERSMLAAAGEALMAKGAHGSYGVFPGFLLSSLAGLVISMVMLGGRVFSRWNAYAGIFGNLFLMIYLILITFFTNLKSIALLLAMPGGLLSLAWMVFATIRLFRLGFDRKESVL